MKRFLATVCATLWVLPSALYAQGLGASQLILTNSSGGGVILQPNPAASSVITYTLPADLTPTSTVGVGILQTNASGNLSWLSPTALAALVEATAWALTGNAITAAWNGATGNFLGTTNTEPLVIATTNTTTPQPIQIWVGNQETFRFNPPGATAPAWSIQRGGGDPRGLHAVDLQSARAVATQVASGSYSVIGGGRDNTASGAYATVGGGYLNDASGDAATVGGGELNRASGSYATVGGGYLNDASGDAATVGGGSTNTASDRYATVGGGLQNTASGFHATVGGGYANTASGYIATVGGGQENTASGAYATVGGGYLNDASGDAATVGGGSTNTASDRYATVGGGLQNTASGFHATVGGGYANTASGYIATVGGGQENTASGAYATVGGGYLNDASGDAATVGGGSTNTASDRYATVGGGLQNTASGFHATVGGGYANTASGYIATVGGGQENTASGAYATVGGGYQNTAGDQYATVGGGSTNTASGYIATVGGGELNRASGAYATVGGGYLNEAIGDAATVGGGEGNDASGAYATVGGGYLNEAIGDAATVGGGEGNDASGAYATVGGGQRNTAIGQYATVGGGQENTAGYIATVGGGERNTAIGLGATVGGGQENTASGAYTTVGGGLQNTAIGLGATVGGGYLNTASGNFSVVPGGSGNTAPGAYNLVFGENVVPSVNETHRVYFFGPGGASPSGRLVINRLSGDFPIHVGTPGGANGNGARLTAAGVWTNASSRSFKERFVQYRPAEVLEKIRQLPVEGYFYKGTEEFHISPMAEDFYRLFGTGAREIIETDSTGQLVRRPDPDVDKYLAASDVAGVALLGVKALDELISTLDPQSTAWALTGNSGTDPTVNFLGTRDAQPLVIRTDNTERMRITETGDVGIGTTTPAATLDVNGTVAFSATATLTNTGSALTLPSNVAVVEIADGAGAADINVNPPTTGTQGQLLFIRYSGTQNLTLVGVLPGGGNQTATAQFHAILMYIGGGWRLMSFVD